MTWRLFAIVLIVLAMLSVAAQAQVGHPCPTEQISATGHLHHHDATVPALPDMPDVTDASAPMAHPCQHVCLWSGLPTVVQASRMIDGVLAPLTCVQRRRGPLVIPSPQEHPPKPAV